MGTRTKIIFLLFQQAQAIFLLKRKKKCIKNVFVSENFHPHQLMVKILYKKLVCLFGFLTSSSTTRLYHGRVQEAEAEPR